MKPDITLNEIGVLKRREIEARILAPMVEELSREFGRDRVLAIVERVITAIARDQGRAIAAGQPAGLEGLAESMAPWKQNGALTMEILEQSPQHFSFDVTRCRYAEMYRDLGIPELGAILSCCRDASFVEGFDPSLTLTRTQTILQGASSCDFRYSRNWSSACSADTEAQL